MAETLLFEIPKTNLGQTPPFEILWFQSIDGTTWADPEIDSISISTLPIDASSGKYIWGSLVADPTLYHQLKTKAEDGTISLAGSVIFPRPMVSYNKPSTFTSGVKLDNSEEALYNLGETVELILKFDDSAVNFGTTLPVKIIDEYENVVASLTANKIGGTTYLVEYTIPLNIAKISNLTGNNITGLNTLRLFDQWLLPDGTNISYSFKTNLVIDNPQSDNSIIKIDIKNLKAEDGSTLEHKDLSFTTKLSPYYSTIEDVMRGEYGYLLQNVNPFDIAQEIIFRSKSVDLHMKPKDIYYEDRYNQAVRSYVRVTTLRHFLTPLGITNSEEKMLDTFKVSRSFGDPAGLIRDFDNQAQAFAKFIWAGGKDTPFVSQLFEKGIFDPNRPSLGRAELDISGWYPWTNATSSSTTVNVDGNNIEIRGVRTISYSQIFNKYSSYSVGSPDRGDVGYLAGGI